MYLPTDRITHTTAFVTPVVALAGTRNSWMDPPHEGSIRRPIAPWANALLIFFRKTLKSSQQNASKPSWSGVPRVIHSACMCTVSRLLIPETVRQKDRPLFIITTMLIAYIHIALHHLNGAMGCWIDPSWGGPIELFLVPASAPRLV